MRGEIQKQISMKKIIFTTTIKEAEAIRKALAFFYISNTKATVEYPDGINEPSPERMELFDVDENDILRIDSLVSWIDNEVAEARKTDPSTTLRVTKTTTK